MNFFLNSFFVFFFSSLLIITAEEVERYDFQFSWTENRHMGKFFIFPKEEKKTCSSWNDIEITALHQDVGKADLWTLSSTNFFGLRKVENWDIWQPKYSFRFSYRSSTQITMWLQYPNGRWWFNIFLFPIWTNKWNSIWIKLFSRRSFTHINFPTLCLFTHHQHPI